MQVDTMSGKYIYQLYLMIFIVMASLFGSRSTIIVITSLVIAAGVLIIIKSGNIIPADKIGSSISNMIIVTLFICALCILIFKIVNATLGEAESKNMELEKSLTENNRILGTCATVAMTLKDTSEDLTINAATFSKNAQVQAAGVEEISSTMEEMLSSVSQNADNSAEAEALSEKSYKLAGEGTEIVNNAVIAINDINESSKKISEIISLMNDIAFQTNLLALNASIEAARAGESGRGFAVVASEVRNLAQRSRAASDEISKLIKNSVEKVEIGTTHVNKSGESLKEIFSSIDQTRKIIEEINLLSREQKEGLGQITTALNQTDTMSQQTASAAEELHSSAEQLKQTSAELQQLMAFFNE
jgi:methyl-accepting chemotaxis protein